MKRFLFLLACAGCFGDKTGLEPLDGATADEGADGAPADKGIGDQAPEMADAGGELGKIMDAGMDVGGPDTAPPTCNPFGAGSCEPGHRCSECADPRVCEGPGTIGTAQPGDPCANSNDCVLGAICASWVDHRCHQICDAAHPCSVGRCTEPLCPDGLYQFCK